MRGQEALGFHVALEHITASPHVMFSMHSFLRSAAVAKLEGTVNRCITAHLSFKVAVRATIPSVKVRGASSLIAVDRTHCAASSVAASATVLKPLVEVERPLVRRRAFAPALRLRLWLVRLSVRSDGALVGTPTFGRSTHACA